MKNQSKIVYMFTITAIAAFCVIAGVWLAAQYRASLQLQAERVFADVLEVMEQQQEIRYKVVSEAGYDISTVRHFQSSDSMYVDVYISSRKDMPKMMKDTIRGIDLSRYGEIFKGLQRKRIDLTGNPSTVAVHRASAQYISNRKSPFSIALVDSLLRERGIVDAEIVTRKSDTMVWDAVRYDKLSLLRPRLIETVPYDIFNSECVVITVPLRASEVFGSMRVILALSVFVAILLIYCILYQLSTIKRLCEIDRLREEMMHKLIRERLREQSHGRNGRYNLGSLVFDTDSNCILNGEVATHLTVRQSDILSLLIENMGKIVLREEILSTIWGNNSASNSLSLNVQVSHLRKILSADPSVTIVTVKGKGLMLTCMRQSLQ